MSSRSVAMRPNLARQAGDAGAGQALDEIDREHAAQIGTVRRNPRQPPAFEDDAQPPHDGLDFGEFGHRAPVARHGRRWKAP